MHYGLRSLFIVVAVIAVYLALTFAVPGTVGFYGLQIINTVGMLAIVSGIIYCRRSWRAFCIGCAVATLPMWIMGGFSTFSTGFVLPIVQGVPDPGWEMRQVFFFMHLNAIVSGFVVVLFRWLFVRLAK